MNKQVTPPPRVSNNVKSSKWDDEDGIAVEKSFDFKLLPNISIESESKYADGKGYKYTDLKTTTIRLEWLVYSIYYTKKSKPAKN